MRALRLIRLFRFAPLLRSVFTVQGVEYAAFLAGSRVMVTNLDNGRSVEVTITDRGPFMKGRKIDLSHKAARMIGMLDKGTARVRITLISKPPGTRDVGAPLFAHVRMAERDSSEGARADCRHRAVRRPTGQMLASTEEKP